MGRSQLIGVSLADNDIDPVPGAGLSVLAMNQCITVQNRHGRG